ncbi:cap-specific mRNA (nucleoside-2'-O-)-methyltransferase 1, partial [Chiloscyllium plagiosum]|uniref:cap-specific mRNA (nucleoside-2'-O-)-methyltransferase 1 n=1 Tax=Chiloscyllium plagiosum TaxID=36176 RepID=UPI001CB81561
ERERERERDSSDDADSDSDEYRPVFGAVSDRCVPPTDSSTDTLSNKYSMYNSVSQKLMAKMGYREGEGLGKFGQGRKEIVEASLQRGRRGLGLKIKGFDGDLDVDWHEETESVFDELEGEEMRRARTRSNPYETIRGVFFLNRAAMKMANIDHVFDSMFTNPRDSLGKPLLRDKDSELLYFADVCAGPGGFSEYVLWRKRWHAKGFGMTLKGPNDFKMEDFFAASSELFEPYYGETRASLSPILHRNNSRQVLQLLSSSAPPSACSPLIYRPPSACSPPHLPPTLGLLPSSSTAHPRPA